MLVTSTPQIAAQSNMQKYSQSCIPLLLLVLAIAALYGQFLGNPILFDDLPFFMMDKSGHQPVDDYRYSLFELRSLPMVTLTWGKAWFGLDMFHFRVENLLLHTAVVLALFFFIQKLLAAMYVGHGESELSSRRAAFFAALLFALHPVAIYAAGYLLQRTIVMATLFSLLSMLAYLHGSVRQKPMWLWVSVPLYYLAVFSKEHAIMLPAVLAALTIILHDDWRARLKQRWLLFAALALIALFAIAASKGVLGSVYEINAPEMLLEALATDSKLAHPLSIMTQSWLFFKYLGMWIFPNPIWMSVDMREPFAQSLFSVYLLASIGFVAWGVAGFWLLLKRGHPGLVGFAMLFPWMMFFTEFSTVRIQEPFVLYRSYLWAAGAFCLLPVLFSKLDGRIATVILAAIALAMMPISMERLKTFSHPLLLWDDAEKLVQGRENLPGAYRIYYNRGTALVSMGKYDEAIADLKQAVAVSKDFAEAYGNMGAAYLKKGDLQNAVASFSQAIEIAHSGKKSISPRYIYGRAMAYEELGEFGKAREDYRVTCSLENMGCEKL